MAYFVHFCEKKNHAGRCLDASGDVYGRRSQCQPLAFCPLVHLCRLKLFCFPFLPFLQGKAHLAPESLLKLLSLFKAALPVVSLRRDSPVPTVHSYIPSAHLRALTGKVHWQENLPTGKQINKQWMRLDLDGHGFALA